ncbi:hypothetical protein BDM02DRAFT_7663 [Thelephora ganbajun]|uniref:Uncharacterized protein n=1 Tax=Thelephora ganbajun TaxID=370292 RepID=A0ACB6ZWA2_THEGA|nr:hypothetical protein BDM02DRAFT_7663 [Thelephora ganbajun]
MPWVPGPVPLVSLIRHPVGYQSPVPIFQRPTGRFASFFDQSFEQHLPHNHPRNRPLHQSHRTMVPAWLQRAQSFDYLEEVLNILEAREQLRAVSRSASKPSDPGYSHPPPESYASPTDKLLTEFYSVSVGGSPVHQIANRYADIEPYDRTRLDPGGHYLNANWVRELHGKKWWIATQAPLPNTAYTFLRVLHEPISPPGLPTSRVRTIVQLTKDVEGGRRKAHPYFPNTIGHSTVIREAQGQGVSGKSFQATLIARNIIEEAHCTQSTVAITPQFQDVAQGQPVLFNHLLYTAWPDHGVPEPSDHQALINFIAQVEKTNRIQTSPTDDPDPPVMVNCSAGIGRTGAFITLSSLLRSYSRLPPAQNTAQLQPPLPQSPLGPLPPEMSEDLIVQEVDCCREQRPGMVQTDVQVVFIYQVLKRVLSSG